MSEEFRVETLFDRAVASGDEKLVLELIAAGYDVNLKNRYGYPPLKLAIEKNHLAIVKILLNAGAIYENSYIHEDLQGPLHLAAYHGCPEIVELFIKLGVDVNSCDNASETALHIVCGFNMEDHPDVKCKIIKILFDAGADINMRDINNDCPLSNAASYGFYAGFQLLLSLGADIYIDGKIDSKILNSAGESFNLEIVKWAVELGLDVNTLDDDGFSPLHSAASNSKSEIVEFLFNNGSVLNVNTYGEDPLFYAIRQWDDPFMSGTNDKETMYKERIKCLDLLITHGADVNRANVDGKTPLYIILENFENLDFGSYYACILLKNGAELDFAHPSVRELMNNVKTVP